MAYRDFKDLNIGTFADKALCDKAFNVSKDPKYDGYERGLAAMVPKFFDKKAFGRGINNENISNKELAKELHKPTIRKFNKIKVHSPLIDNIWGADLADIQLISKFNKGIYFILCVIDIAVMHELFHWKVKKAFQLWMLFRKFQKNLIENQTKYG